MKAKPKTKGGKREGSGRKPLDPAGTMTISVRLTGEQKATFDLVGGRQWLRDHLDAITEGRKLW